MKTTGVTHVELDTKLNVYSVSTCGREGGRREGGEGWREWGREGGRRGEREKERGGGGNGGEGEREKEGEGEEERETGRRGREKGREIVMGVLKRLSAVVGCGKEVLIWFPVHPN